jgi:hypothetical protein
MQAWSSSFRHKNKGDGDNVDNKDNNSNVDENEDYMPRKQQYRDLEASPFDEPPMLDDLDLGRFIYSMNLGPSPPPSMSFASMSPKRASSVGVDTGRCRSDDDDDGASKPHDEARYYDGLQQPNISKPTSPSSFRRFTSFSLRRNRNKRTPSLKNGKDKSKRKKRLSFSRQLVDVVPEQWLNRRHRQQQRDATFSIVSSRQEDDLFDDGEEEDDVDYEDDDLSFWSQEMSLEYFLLGEWIEKDDLLSPINCEGLTLRDDHPNADPENIYEDSCRSDGNTSCFPVLDASHCRSQPFSIPFRWREYTTLDSTECLGSSWCRGDFCLDNFKINENTSVTQFHLFEDSGIQEASNACQSPQIPTSVREILPSMQFLQDIVEGIFENPISQASVNGDYMKRTSDDMKRTSEYTNRTREDIMNHEVSDVDALSCSMIDLSDSEDSTLANTSIDLTVKVTAE